MFCWGLGLGLRDVAVHHECFVLVCELASPSLLCIYVFFTFPALDPVTVFLRIATIMIFAQGNMFRRVTATAGNIVPGLA